MPRTDNTCICCGRVIPEGQHVCILCTKKSELQDFGGKPKTNADRIRSMTDEELIPVVMHWVCKLHPDRCPCTDCDDCVRRWLRKESAP